MSLLRITEDYIPQVGDILGTNPSINYNREHYQIDFIENEKIYFSSCSGSEDTPYITCSISYEGHQINPYSCLRYNKFQRENSYHTLNSLLSNNVLVYAWYVNQYHGLIKRNLIPKTRLKFLK